ncbi:hypothetical protein IAU59_003714 [Kwoniella sp. CBS 9459]
MVAMTKKPKFDPAAHLHKHGWKGKGTALKHGHSTRPLAVVQKKTLSGIGKDRDEAVPFWDHIFAATAASLFSASPTPAPSNSGSPGPGPSSSSWAPSPLNVDSRGNKLAPAPGDLTVGSAAKPKLSINATARAGKELARRGLYSRFLRGKVLVPEPESESESDSEDDAKDEDEVDGDEHENGEAKSIKSMQETETIEAGPSNANIHNIANPTRQASEDEEKSSKRKRKDKGKGRENDKEEDGQETKEERRARRAEKARRQAEKKQKSSALPSGNASGEEEPGGVEGVLELNGVGNGDKIETTLKSKSKSKTESKSKKRKAKSVEEDEERDRMDGVVEEQAQDNKPEKRRSGQSKEKKEKRRKENPEDIDVISESKVTATLSSEKKRSKDKKGRKKTSSE